jgi:hypothetical protein
VHAREDNNDLTVDAIKDCIREAAEKHSPCLSMNHRIRGGVRKDIFEGGLDGCQKFLAEASPLPVVPRKRLLNIRGSRWTDEDLHHWARPWIRRSTSSQGMPPGPSRSSSSRRRSSSSRWAMVSGIASGVRERLSQSSSRSRSRSSKVRLEMSMLAMRSVYRTFIFAAQVARPWSPGSRFLVWELREDCKVSEKRKFALPTPALVARFALGECTSKGIERVAGSHGMGFVARAFLQTVP